ncbi:YTH YT521-B-like family protein, putative [Ichthyophthirius multifiliis]|uniref:YTH YT521-B-like family protein, putative n=1 Tax=Ichthyophthirius multifiliis TaxID=5932 RepID=G0R5U6_ICHMU|nr:YTH YT521-B-like family protein, putative [Ichthyophthirius multifiliis]EGR27167.1 YTH YT521-B-like family protein, putative [Ichthyophthirius multifiliis]|eukprot:XP_004024051.1 YTH YT521-B-like family protein, putative [Ichthyophthirius multifiliis]
MNQNTSEQQQQQVETQQNLQDQAQVEQQNKEKPEEQIVNNQESNYSKKVKYFKHQYRYCKNYDSLNEIVEIFPHLSSLQQPLDINTINNAICLVMRSNNDDDIHKAIKYGIWTSVPQNNVKLNEIYKTSQNNSQDVFLFFSVVKSGQFVGVAKLKSGFIDETFSYWWQPLKFKGHFKLEWVFVKDVKQKNFEDLKNMCELPVSRSKDCTEVDFQQTGKRMLQIFQESDQKQSIFQEFTFMDEREKMLRQMRQYNSFNNNNFYNQRGQDQVINQFIMQPQFNLINTEYFQQFQKECLQNIYPPTNVFPQQNNNYHNNNNNGFKKFYNNVNGPNKGNYQKQKKFVKNHNYNNGEQNQQQKQ